MLRNLGSRRESRAAVLGELRMLGTRELEKEQVSDAGGEGKGAPSLSGRLETFRFQDLIIFPS